MRVPKYTIKCVRSRATGKHDRDLVEEAIERLDEFEVDQGGLGSYVISVTAAQFKEPRRPLEPRVRPAPPPAPAPSRGAANAFSAPNDCPKALLRNCFDAGKAAGARDASLEEEFGIECNRKYGRVLDAECVVAGRDAGAVLVSRVAAAPRRTPPSLPPYRRARSKEGPWQVHERRARAQVLRGDARALL